MTDRKVRTVLRNVRIPKELNAILEKDAAAENRTLSALVVSILTKYAEFDRFTSKFGFVTVPRSNYQRMIDAMDEQKYPKALAEATSTLLEMVRFWFGRIDADAICDFTERIGKYAGTTKCQVTRGSGVYTITLQHELGLKFSNILKHIFEEGIRIALGTETKTEITLNSTFIKFSR